MPFELSFLTWIQNNLVSDTLTPIMKFFTEIGNYAIPWIIIIILLLIFPQTRKFGVIAACALLLDALICNGILKPLIDRPRPFTQVDITLLIPTPGPHSFPSGHTASSFAVAAAVCFWKKGWGIGALVLAALIAFSRMYFFVHYPTDILGGIVVGVGCAFLAKYIVDKVYPKNKSESNSGKA